MRKECEKGKMIVKHDDSAFICLPFHSYPSGKNWEKNWTEQFAETKLNKLQKLRNKGHYGLSELMLSWTSLKNRQPASPPSWHPSVLLPKPLLPFTLFSLVLLLATECAGEGVQLAGERSVSGLITFVAGDRASFAAAGKRHCAFRREEKVSKTIKVISWNLGKVIRISRTSKIKSKTLASNWEECSCWWLELKLIKSRNHSHKINQY